MAPNTPTSGTDNLVELAAEIKDALSRARRANEQRLGYYRSAGERLNCAKDLVPHGQWADWLEENCELSERTAQKYMKFAKAPRKADLEEEEEAWRSASGAAKKLEDAERGQPQAPSPTQEPSRPTEKGQKPQKLRPNPEDVPDDGSREYTFTLPKAQADELDRLLQDLKAAWNTSDNATTFVKAVRVAHEEVTRG